MVLFASFNIIFVNNNISLPLALEMKGNCKYWGTFSFTQGITLEEPLQLLTSPCTTNTITKFDTSQKMNTVLRLGSKIFKILT